MTKIRWGIIGAGRIAHTFCKDIVFSNNAEVTAIASRSAQSAKQFAEQYHIEKHYGDYPAILDDTQIDALYIATPHTVHFEQTQAALEAGKHVLCEKPFTVSSHQCQQLIQLATDKQLFLMEAIWTYFLPVINTAQQWIAQDRIGKVLHVKADFGYPLPYDAQRREYNAELAGGCLLEMGIYPLALAQLFIGASPESRQLSGHLAPNGVEDEVLIQAKYPEDIFATLHTSFRAKLQNWAYIIGEQGYIAIPDFWRADQCMLYQLDDQIDHFKDNRKGSGFEFQIQAASQCIVEGKTQSSIMPLATSLALQQQMESILSRIKT